MNNGIRTSLISILLGLLVVALCPEALFASETDLVLPSLAVNFSLFGSEVSGIAILSSA